MLLGDILTLLLLLLAMKRMAASNVLIVGMSGLGVEIGEQTHSYIYYTWVMLVPF